MTTCVVCAAKTFMDALVPAGTIAAVVSVCPAADQVMVAAVGCVDPVGHAVRNPCAAVPVTEMLNEYAAALPGIPTHGPAGTLYVRVSPWLMIGPPNAPFAFRVSRTRHGTMVMKCDAAEGTAFGFGWSARSATRIGCVSAIVPRICSNGTGQSRSGTRSS